MEIAFHCPNCSADLIYDESKKYTCCFCHTVLGPRDEVRELEGGYYVGDAWNSNLYHSYRCNNCRTEFIAKAAKIVECPLCAGSSVKDMGEHIGAMPRRVIPFTQTKAKAEEVFLDYIRNNSVVGKIMATEENAALLRKVYVPIWVFNYEVIAYAKISANIRNKANESTTIMGFNVPGQVMESLDSIRTSFSRFRQNRKGTVEPVDLPTEYTTGGILSWQGIPFDASGNLPPNVMTALQPYDQTKLAKATEKLLADAPVLAISKDPISAMEEFMERIKKWTRQMIMDSHSASYEIVHFSDKTDYPLGIGELVLFPVWYMKSEYDGREFFFAMNGQNGEVEAKIPMAKMSKKSNTISYDQYWDKERCTALLDAHFEFNIHDPNIEILDYSFFEKPKNSRVTADGSDVAPHDSDTIFDEVIPEEEPEPAPKPVEKTGLEVENLRTDKKLTKEEEAKRAREVTARLRVAAKETTKGGMSAAAEAPTWAKAVTPPPAATNASRPAARTKKSSAARPTKASVANKPIWERTEEDEAAINSKPVSLADRIAQNQGGDVPAPAAAMEEPEINPGRSGIMGDVAAMQEELNQASAYEVPAKKSSMAEEAYEVPVAATADELDAYEVPMPKTKKSTRSTKAAKKEIEPAVEEAPIEEPTAEEGEEMITNITFSFPKKKKPAYSGEPTMSGTSIPRRSEKAPEVAQGMAIMNSEYEGGILPGSSLQHAVVDDEVREIVPKVNASENYIGSDQNDRPLASRPLAPLARRNDDVYVEETDIHPELDENNRPLAKRPPAPLARVTEAEPSLEYLVENPLDDDIHQMPSIENKKSKWGEMPKASETPAWAKPQHMQREDDEEVSPMRAQMQARMASPRERVRRPSREELMAMDRARNEDAEARTGISRPAAQRPGAARMNAKQQAEEEVRRPAYMAAVEQPKAMEPVEQEEEEVRPISSAFKPATRPGSRPAMRKEEPEEVEENVARPATRTAGRPGAGRASSMREAATKNVPIWERVPENDGSRPEWATSSSVYEDERPRGSLSKPAGQVIDVEKPRTRPSVWRPDADSSAKEVLPGSMASEYRTEERDVPLRSESESDEVREIPVRRSYVERMPQVETVETEEAVEEVVPKSRATRRPASGIEVEMPEIVPIVDEEPVVEETMEPQVEETPVAPAVPERPRTFAQRRQMEEEERRRQIQSSFGTPTTGRPGSVFAARQEEEVDEEETINRTFESTQFENKPSVVASLDQLPEALDDDSIHHLAKDDSIPALARGVDKVRDEVAASEKNARRAMRDLPDFDPDGPSPFKR